MAISYADACRKGIKPVEKSLFEYLTSTYPHPDNNGLDTYIQNNRERLRNWTDLAKIIAEHEEIGDEKMNVYKSSVWAVCQEFLGKIPDDKLYYTTTRGGIWSETIQETKIDGKIKVNVTIVDLRDILADIKAKYP